ncbi:MAG: pilus assembly protein TadG-related protein [Sphingomicrobium sp.]
MRRTIRNLFADKKGSVAPIVALSLFALIAGGGIAFDYARLAGLDTELQNAADQAALAAVTQLDQQSGATTRAVTAAQSLLINQTRFGNDGGTTVLTGQSYTSGSSTVARVTFYSTKADAEAGTNGYGVGSGNDAIAKFVKVDVTGREAIYAFTPVVGALRSGTINASAVAGLGSAICKVPPVMMCNPAEPDTNTNVNLAFDANALKGAGIRLVSVGNGNTAWAPGNFGYLDTGSSTSNPNVELRQALGWTSAPGNCSSLDGVQTRTGAGTPVTQALNTRFDVYEKANTGNGNAASCPTGGTCPASINTVKDLIQKGTPNAANKCGVANNEWELPPAAGRYLPANTTDLTPTQISSIQAMGYPRDKCHAISQNGLCSGDKIGDKAWDRNAYFQVNYGWTNAQWTGFLATGSSPVATPASATRYDVYRWEIANKGSTFGTKTILASRAYGSGGNPETDFDSPVCSPLQGYGNGLTPGGATVDRRRISTAVINCHARDVHGGGNTVYPVLKWVEMFLVEPSVNRDRTDANDVYAEMIGETTLGSAGSTSGQVVRRDVPYLIK